MFDRARNAKRIPLAVNRHETSKAAYLRHVYELGKRTQELQKLISELENETMPHWGHVGDLAHSLGHVEDAVAALKGEIR